MDRKLIGSVPLDSASTLVKPADLRSLPPGVEVGGSLRSSGELTDG